MTKKVKKSQKDQRLQFPKRFWWILAALLIVLVWPAYFFISRQATNTRFDETYKQLEHTNNSLSDTAVGFNNPHTSLKKICKKNWYGFNSEIECGAYLDIKSYPSDIQEFGVKLNQALIKNEFKDINIQTGREGSASFTSKSGMKCKAHWRDEEGGIAISSYCRESVPDYVRGYERE